MSSPSTRKVSDLQPECPRSGRARKSPHGSWKSKKRRFIFPCCFRPDRTFAVDWALKTNDLLSPAAVADSLIDIHHYITIGKHNYHVRNCMLQLFSAALAAAVVLLILLVIRQTEFPKSHWSKGKTASWFLSVQGRTKSGRGGVQN